MIWNVDPILLHIGRIQIGWYGIFFAAGFLCGLRMMRWMYQRDGRNLAELDPLLWFILIGTMAGMRLGHCFFYEPRYYLAHPLEIPQIWLGGYASHGGAVGLLLAVYLYCRAPGRPAFLWLLDRLAIPAVLAGAFIRIGNFFRSEIVGTPTTSIFGVVFERVDSLPRHPVQLYEAAVYLVIFVALLVLYLRRRSVADGAIAGWYFVLVFVARFFLEFFKTAQASYESDFAIHVGQYLSVPFIALGIFLVIRTMRRGVTDTAH